MKKVPTPAGMGKTGSAQWRAITGSYDLRVDELSVLADACRMSDMITAMEQAFVEDGCPMTTKGSMGQLVTHPLISELRQYRATHARMLAQLKLPDEGSSDQGGELSAKNRAAANARWSRRGA